MASDRKILHELTPLKETDALYIADRHKKEFTYPIHSHKEYELNFVEGAAGVNRIVGDSRERIGNYDLVLITSGELEHVWEQGECKSEDIREITMQFYFGLDDNDPFFQKTPFHKIHHMMEAARKGLAFSQHTIMKVYNQLDELTKITDRFMALMKFLMLLNDLAGSDDMRTLASSSFAKVVLDEDSRQIENVKNFIAQNYMYELKLEDVASVANMSKSAFSRFFKLHSGRCLSDYVIDVRMGNASRLLLDTDDTISNISFKVGFNNLSNFNRTFRRLKGCTPTEFRQIYRKKRIIV
ncbi:MAG: AraC family transcriptional regulator [Prevotella sp.]|jgi:AraC-like DNA-binding protein